MPSATRSRSKTSKPAGLVQGTLDMLVLRALADGAKHGYGVMRFLRAASDEMLQIEEGALYPALHRMADRGWIEAEWGVSENNRRAKFYRTTSLGQRHLDRETREWRRYVAMVDQVLGPQLAVGEA